MKDESTSKIRINLDETRLRALDPGDMLGKTLELPGQLRKGLDLGKNFAKDAGLRAPENSVLDWIGLGGSAVAGDLLQGFGIEPPLMPLRVTVRRSPRPSCDQRMLCSYSGNTIETVKAFEDVPARQIWFSMSSGGKLQDLAAKAKTPHLMLPGGYPPRAAVGFSLGAVMAIYNHVYKFSPDSSFGIPWKDLESDGKLYEKLYLEQNPALLLASNLTDRTPVIYTTDGMTMPSLAFRFRAQLAENSKVWSHASDLPEMAHNEVEAFANLGQVLPPPVVIFLGSWNVGDRFMDPRPGLKTILDQLSIRHLTLDPSEIWGATSSRIASCLRLMFLLDAATIYLALLRATDPLEIPLITRLKSSTTKA